jgi:hypothetical protein
MDTRREAMDTALMQSAYCFISGELGLNNENWAKNSFKQFVNRFIHAETRVVPLPSGELGKANEFINLWSKGKDVEKVTDLGPPVNSPELRHALLKEIMWDISNLAEPISSWIAMQWTPQIVEEYLSRGSTEHINAVVEEFSSVLDGLNSSSLYKLISQRIFKDDYIIDRRYIDGARNAGVDVTTYAIAYGISCQLRGRQYAEGLGEKMPGIRYTYHWIRDRMVGVEGVDKISGTSNSSDYEIDWGNILLAQIASGNLQSDVMRVKDCLIKLHSRVTSKQYKEQLTYLKQLREENDEGFESELDIIKLEILGYLGIPPLYRDTTLGGKLASSAKDMSKHIDNKFIKTSFQTIDLFANSNRVRHLDAWVVRKISLNWFWRNFKVPGVRA